MTDATTTNIDELHLMRAIELAEQARGRTSPNPLVGAVLVKDGRVIGEGFHSAAGEPHAEREALAVASEDPAGATLNQILVNGVDVTSAGTITEGIQLCGAQRHRRRAGGEAQRHHQQRDGGCGHSEH